MKSDCRTVVGWDSFRGRHFIQFTASRENVFTGVVGDCLLTWVLQRRRKMKKRRTLTKREQIPQMLAERNGNERKRKNE